MNNKNLIKGKDFISLRNRAINIYGAKDLDYSK